MYTTSAISTPLAVPTKSPWKFVAFSKCQAKLTEMFKLKVAPLYGDQTFNIERFESGLSRRCEAAKYKGKVVGAISYLHKLQPIGIGEASDSFEVRNLILAKDKYYNKPDYQESLYQRVAKLANDRQASQIHFLVPSKDKSLVQFLKDKGFEDKGNKMVSKDKIEVAVFYRVINQSKTPLVDTQIKKHEKRKRTEEDETIGLGADIAVKKNRSSSIEIKKEEELKTKEEKKLENRKKKETTSPPSFQEKQQEAVFKPILIDIGTRVEQRNNNSNDRNDYRSNDRNDYRSNDRNDYRSNDRNDYRSNDRNDYRSNDRNDYRSNDRNDYRSNDRPQFNRSLSTSAISQQGKSPSRHHELTLKKIYIHQIRSGLKTVEGRIWSTVQRYRPGDTLRFFYGAVPQDDVKCKILKIEKYESFPQMLQQCGFQKCLADVRTLREAENIYASIPGYPERAAQHGVAAIHLEVIRST